MKHSFSSSLPASKKIAKNTKKSKKTSHQVLSQPADLIHRSIATGEEINLPLVEASLKAASDQLKSAILTKEEQEALVSYLLDMEITRFKLLAERPGNRLEKYLQTH